MPPDRPRKLAIDPSADEICPPSDWVLETLHRAKCLGLHPNQRRVIGTLLGWTEIGECDLPRMWFGAKTEVASVTLLWAGKGYLVEAGLHWSHVEGWRTRLTLREGKRIIRQFWPRHPAEPLRAMLSRVDPGLFEGGREAP